MEIKKVQSVGVAVAVVVGDYSIEGIVTVKENGTAEQVQGGRVLLSGNTEATFTSWNVNHLNVESSNSAALVDYITAIKQYLTTVRAAIYQATVIVNA